MVTMFSKRHYEAIAEVFGQAIKFEDSDHTYTSLGEDAIRRCAKRLADLFESDNPRFDRAKFEEACER